MKAIACPKYGTPDVLQLQEVETPVPKEKEIRIKLRAAAVTPADCAFRKANPFMIRLLYGLFRPKYSILGVEFAGEVESLGKDVSLFQVGDSVFGISPTTFGTYAEYKCMPESAVVSAKPASMSYEEAVGLCDGALTALTFLRDVARIERGQKVLINGASGAVGVYAVQLAKHFGAEVTGVCSTPNVELVTSLGADQVIDYTQGDFTQSGQTYDIIFDAVGKRSYTSCKHSLTPNGVYLTTVPGAAIMLQMLWTSMRSGRKAKFVAAGLNQRKDNLLYIQSLAETGKLRPVIDRRYPLEQTAEAHRYVETERKKGNVVLTIGT